MIKFTDNLTICIPVYMRYDYFEKAIESAINQTVKCKILVSDNGSTHNKFEEYCKINDIEYYKNSVNVGMFPNWNLCYKYAKTKYVMILGDDDIINANYVESFINALNKYPEIDIYFTNFSVYSHETSQSKNHHHTLPYGYMENGEKILEYGIKYKLGFPCISCIIKKDKFSGYYEPFHASNDWEWIYRNISKMHVYGEEVIMTKYGYHTKNDSKNIDTHLKCMLSIAYIYEKNLSGFFNDSTFLTKIAKYNAINSLLYFGSYADKKMITDILNNGSIYGIYFREKFNNSLIYRFFLLFPSYMKVFMYKISNKAFNWYLQKYVL